MKTSLINTEDIREFIKYLTTYSISKAVLVVVSVMNLIITNDYVVAILKMENEIVGFIMFLYVLFGLVVLFQSVRMSFDKWGGSILTVIAIGITLWLGIKFYNLCNVAVLTQKSLKDPTVVIYAMRLIRFTIIGYIIGLGILITHLVKLFKSEA